MGVAAGIGVTLVSFAGLRNFFVIISALLVYSLLAGLLVLPAIYAVIAGYKKYDGNLMKAFGVPSFVSKEEEKRTYSDPQVSHDRGKGTGSEGQGRAARLISHLPHKKEPIPAKEVTDEKVMEAENIEWEDAEFIDDAEEDPE